VGQWCGGGNRFGHCRSGFGTRHDRRTCGPPGGGRRHGGRSDDGGLPIGDKSFWVDEAFTISHASTSTAEFFDVLLTREANGAIHGVIEVGLVRVDGTGW